MWPKLIIFDFDGVIADSGTLACGVAADYATELGASLNAAEGLALFMGKRVDDVKALISNRGAAAPANFETELEKRTLEAFALKLKAVDGFEAFIGLHEGIPHCIASSSSHRRLAASLELLGLARQFEGRVFSAEDVSRGKPSPDLFLYAAQSMRTGPADALVIEDSISGIAAALSAGMRVVGFTGGSHFDDCSVDGLTTAGATTVVRSYAELSDWMLRNKDC